MSQPVSIFTCTAAQLVNQVSTLWNLFVCIGFTQYTFSICSICAYPNKCSIISCNINDCEQRWMEQHTVIEFQIASFAKLFTKSSIRITIHIKLLKSPKNRPQPNYMNATVTLQFIEALLFLGNITLNYSTCSLCMPKQSMSQSRKQNFLGEIVWFVLSWAVEE